MSLAVYFGLLETLVTRQLMLGQSAVVDCVMNDSIVARWTKNFDAPLVVVECVCSDEDLHRSRLNGRRRNIPGWHEVDWDHVERMRVEFPPLAHKHLTADSIEPLEDNVRKVLGNTRRCGG